MKLWTIWSNGKDYPTKKLIKNYVKMECKYKEAQIPLFATWKFKDSNNQSEYTFILVNDPNLARGLIQISGCISLKKLDTVLFFEKYEYRSK